MWPKLLDMSKDECKRLLRRTELEAYAGIITAFRAQGVLSKEKKQLLNELATTLSISTERHRAEVRRAVNDEKLSTVAERLSGPNNSSEWAIEGRRLIPLMPRLVPQTVFSLTANQAANAAFSHNLTLPLPSETAKKEAPGGSENSVKLPSPSSNVVVLPSGLSIPIKGGSEVDAESLPTKKSRRDSSASLSKEVSTSSVPAQVLHSSSSPPPSVLSAMTTKAAGSHAITTNRSQSVPATKHQAGYHVVTSKQPGSRPVVGRSSPLSLAATSTALKAGFGPAQSPLKFTYTKASSVTGNTTPASSAQKVILVSSSATSFTPSILQRSHSAPSSKSPMAKAGTKQSVILTSSVGGQPLVSRQPEVLSSSRQSIATSGRQHATISSAPMAGGHKAMQAGRQGDVGSGHMTAPDALVGAIAGMTGTRKLTGNVGTVPAMNSTVITARTTASVIGSQMTSYVSTNVAGKPRGRAVSKQKVMRQMNVTPASGMTTLPTGETTASKKQPMHFKQDSGVKVVTQSLLTTSTRQQRAPNQPHAMETSFKASMATAAMPTGKPVTTMAGHKVIISTTSAGVAPHHVATTAPLNRTKPGGMTSSIGTVVSKVLHGGTMSVSGSPKMAASGTMTNPKMVQTIKGATTANVSQTVTSITQIISSKPSMVMQKTFPAASQGGVSDPSKHPQAHMTSALLHRPRISMVSGTPTTPTGPSFSSTGIRFPAPQSTNSIAMTTVKSPGSRRMRNPITMVTTGASSIQQRRSVPLVSPNALQGSGNVGTVGDVPTGNQTRDYQGGLTRGLIGSCSHPNSEWIDYDGTPPDSSASSAIKALLEFRSNPDARKHSQTIDLSHMGTTAPPKSTSVTPATHCTTAPSRLSQHALLTARTSQHAVDLTAVALSRSGIAQHSPTLLSNMQSRLKKALMSERPAAAASVLQTATSELEKAIQEQNIALRAKCEVPPQQTGMSSSSQGGGRGSPGRGALAASQKKRQPEKPGSESQHVTVEDQGVVTERLNLSSEDVSSFVDQFEQFLEREGLEDVLKGVVSPSRGQSQTDQPAGSKPSESKPTGRASDSFQLLARAAASKPHLMPAHSAPARDWSDESANRSAADVTPLPSWGNKPGLETLVTAGQKGAASVVMESSSVDISQMKLEDFTSQRLQDSEDAEEEKQNVTSPETSPVKTTGDSPGMTMGTGSGSGSEEMQSVRISSRKRKAPPPIDEEPGPTSMSSWARAAFNLLQRVMRFRGANRSKGDLNAASWFTRPVAVTEAPGYNRVIKTPMDFGTVKRKLESGQYDDFQGFHGDMLLVRDNCVQYNPPGHEIRRDCEEVFQFYTTEYTKLIERWEKPSPKKPKPDDHHGDKGKPAAARPVLQK